MSGGSYDYAYRHMEEFAERLRLNGSVHAAPQGMRIAFAAHCRKVADAMRACEWNDSGDGDSSETDLIAQLVSHEDILDEAVSSIEGAASQVIDTMQTVRMAIAKKKAVPRKKKPRP